MDGVHFRGILALYQDDGYGLAAVLSVAKIKSDYLRDSRLHDALLAYCCQPKGDRLRYWSCEPVGMGTEATRTFICIVHVIYM